MESPAIQVQEEILLARESRREGNEGRARVCSRRAAGAAAREFLFQRGSAGAHDNAIQSLRKLLQFEQLPERIVEAVQRLLMRVDENSDLPEGIDLISEAKLVIQYIDSCDRL